MVQESTIERQVAELLALAREFTRLMENNESVTSETFSAFLYRISMLLYVSGMAIPETEEPELTGEHYVTEEQWELIFNQVRNKLGEQDILFYCSDTEIETGSLAEYCADIYQDLKDFELQLSKSTTHAVGFALYDVKKLFKNHWGIRLLRIQSHLHQIYNPVKETLDEYNFFD